MPKNAISPQLSKSKLEWLELSHPYVQSFYHKGRNNHTLKVKIINSLIPMSGIFRNVKNKSNFPIYQQNELSHSSPSTDDWFVLVCFNFSNLMVYIASASRESVRYEAMEMMIITAHESSSQQNDQHIRFFIRVHSRIMFENEEHH